MVTLIVEDGTGVPDANTYIDIAYLDEYANQRGYHIPVTIEQRANFILRAMDYLEYFADSLGGSRLLDDQVLSWPRRQYYFNGVLLAENFIPENLKRAQAQLVVEQQMRTPLFPRPITSAVEGLVTEKTMGPMKKRFSGRAPGGNRLANPTQPIQIASVMVFLKPLLNGGGSGCWYKQTIRV